jgi:hypothetical protein
MALPQFAYQGVGYRGLTLDGNAELARKYADYKTEFVVGDLMTFPAFMSVSTDDSVADDFGDFLFFVFVNVTGARIALLSLLPKEAEILVPPPSVFRIKAVAKFGGRLTITLDQEPSPLTYLSNTAPVPVALSTLPAAAPAAAAAAAAAPSSLIADLAVPQVALLVKSVKPSFHKYAAAIVEHDVSGIFIQNATDDELAALFDQMHVGLTHKVELRCAVGQWRANPQQALQAIKRQAQADADDELRKAEELRKAAAAPPPKSIVFNGHVYKSLAEHDPHSTKPINEYEKRYNLDPAWHICSPTPDAVHVCAAYPWAAYALIFADGSAHFTALGPKSHPSLTPGTQGADSNSNTLYSKGGQYGITYLCGRHHLDLNCNPTAPKTDRVHGFLAADILIARKL